MTVKDLEIFKALFSDYSRSFSRTDPEEQKNILLKVEHTFKVVETIRRIAEGLALPAEKVLIAEAAGLFHDIGRFPQYAQYKTFRDSISVNHGSLGAGILIEEGFLRDLREEERRIIVNAVKFHNAFVVPDLPDPEDVFFLRMVRDADKLDIWRIFLGFFEGREDERASEANLGLPDLPSYEEDIISSILGNRTVSFRVLKTLNDFKLMQLSWVFDLNFLPSFALLGENNYIERLAATLPRTKEIRNVSSLLQDFARRKLKPASDKGKLHSDGLVR